MEFIFGKMIINEQIYFLLIFHFGDNKIYQKS